MQVRLTRNVLIGTEVRRAGTTVSVGDDLAKELVESKLAERARQAQDGEQGTTKTPKPTKAEMLSAAEAEGLKLEVTKDNTVAEIEAAIAEARQAQDGEQED